MIQESYFTIMGHLDNVTWMHYNPLPLLEDNNITEPLQKGIRWSIWFISEKTFCTNDSIIFLNVDNSTLYTKGNVYGIIDIFLIEIIFDNYYIHILNDMPDKLRFFH